MEEAINPETFDRLLASLRASEGYRGRIYRDSRGTPTLGYGHNLAVSIPREAAELILRADAERTVAAVRRVFAGFDAFSTKRQLALAELMFNLGPRGLAGFRRMIAAVRAGDWEGAAREMRDSRWAAQVGARALRLARKVRGG